LFLGWHIDYRPELPLCRADCVAKRAVPAMSFQPEEAEANNEPVSQEPRAVSPAGRATLAYPLSAYRSDRTLSRSSCEQSSRHQNAHTRHVNSLTNRADSELLRNSPRFGQDLCTGGCRPLPSLRAPETVGLCCYSDLRLAKYL
jgi:hypothetical protein